MEEVWFKREGFYSNPFSIKPAAFHDEIVGYKLEPILQRIKEGNVVFVEAPLGSGKTTILKRIFRIFEGRGKLIYCSHTSSERIDVERLLRRASIFGKLFGTLTKNVILLVDEASDITQEDSKDILTYLEQGNLKSAVFFGTKYAPSRFPTGLGRLLNGNVVRLSHLTPEQAVEMVRKRIGNIPLISDEVIKQVFVRLNYNPRRLLEACEDICREAVSSSADTAKPEHIEKVLGGVKTNRTVRKRKKKTARSEPKLIIHEMKVDSADNFNLQNIRTYEQEMSLIKQKKEEEKI